MSHASHDEGGIAGSVKQAEDSRQSEGGSKEADEGHIDAPKSNVVTGDMGTRKEEGAPTEGVDTTISTTKATAASSTTDKAVDADMEHAATSQDPQVASSEAGSSAGQMGSSDSTAGPVTHDAESTSAEKAAPDVSSRDGDQSTVAQEAGGKGQQLPQNGNTEAAEAQEKHAGAFKEAATTVKAAEDNSTAESTDHSRAARQEGSDSDATTSRDLPAPPAPLKTPTRQAHSPSQDEVAEVARAFGVSASIDTGTLSGDTPPAPHDKDKSVATSIGTASSSSSATKTGGLRIGKGPPPTTMASEEKPFDFNRFLEQMRHKSAGPVGEYVRSFIKGFTMKPYRAADQTKLIFDFLDFIAVRMRECDIWNNATDVEFENATEAMEKLIMNRLYNYTFTPAIRREGKWSVQTDDLERDRVLKQRIKLFGWIEEKHLDVPTGDHSKGFVDFAMQELLKINHYKAPRDKVICILNSCKVIFGLIRHLSTEENADTFIPVLIFVVLRSNPDHLISNVEYISRFRNPDKLSSESGYYLSSLMGAIAFIETMDYTSLSNITRQEFEQNVEEAVLSMGAQAEQTDGQVDGLDMPQEKRNTAAGMRTPSPAPPMANAEESARILPVSAGASALAEDTRAFFQRTGKAAKAGIGASLGGPMTALGRLFQEGLEGPRTPSGSSPLALSGRATPESPSPANVMQPPAPSARSRMWNLFGADTNEPYRSPQVQHENVQPYQKQQHTASASYPTRPRGQQQQQQQQQGGTRSASSAAPLNISSWGRSMRADPESEPPTPQSEELQQGRFATLEALQGSNHRTPAARNFGAESTGLPATGLPRRPPQLPRQGSIDPYTMQDEDAMDGVRTPSDEGSVTSPTSPSHAGALRSRLGELGGYLPSILSDQRGGATSTQHGAATRPTNQPLPPRLDDEQAVQAAAQIDEAHLNAGVDTLKSIFPHTETSVCRLVLEGCDGHVQAAIDKLLEMS